MDGLVCVPVAGGPIGAEPEPVAGGGWLVGGGCVAVCAIAAPVKRTAAKLMLISFSIVVSNSVHQWV